MRTLPVVSFEGLSKCEHCSLQPQRDKTYCPAFQPPGRFNGLMVIGEGPGTNEARLKMPFIGRAGQLLDKLLERAGIRREETWITNATSCLPPPSPAQRGGGKKMGFSDLHPWAVPACLPRLSREIEHVQPRVILALGQAALLALTGDWKARKVRQKLPTCTLCKGEMTLPCWTCAGCKTTHFLPAGHSGWCGKDMDATCPVCGQSGHVGVAAKKRRCPTCEGRKTAAVVEWRWRTPHSVMSTVGTVFRGRYGADILNVPEEARLDLPCAYMIPSYHPSFLLRDPDKKTKKQPGGQFLVNASIEHFLKAARLLVEDAHWPFHYSVVRPTDPSEPEASFEELQALLTSGRAVAADIETDAKEAWNVTKIQCIGFTVRELERAITFNTDGVDPSDPHLQWLQGWLRDPRYPKVFQNGIYDTQVLWHVWQVEVQGYHGDTLLAHNAVCPDEPHDLQHLAGVYTDSPLWKPPRKDKDGKLVYESSAQLRIYNARDAFNTGWIWHREERHMEAEQARFVHDLDLGMVFCAREMERVGLPISKPKWEEWQARATHYRDAALARMYQFLGTDAFNPDSPPHVQYALFDRHGPLRLVPSKYTDPSPTFPKGQPSTAKTALLDHKAHPFVSDLLDYRRWDRVLSVYFGGMTVSTDYRLRVRWNPIGARTGRWSTSPNLQNWFKTILVQLKEGWALFAADQRALAEVVEDWGRIPGIREVVVAPPGRKIVGADLSQAELRVLAALSGDKTLIELLARGDQRVAELKAQGVPKAERDLVKYDPQYDVHSYVASLAFADAYLGADVHIAHGLEVRSRLRDLIKRVIYGLNYGAGVDTILEAIYDGEYEGPPITADQIERVIAAYFRAFPRIKVWREQTRQKAEKTGRVTDALIGRRREFPLLHVDVTVAYNFAIQATVGSLMNLIMFELYHALRGVDPSARLLAQVHDAIYIECAEDRADDVAKLLERTMSQRLRLVDDAPFMDFPASAKVANNWFQAG